MTTRKTSIFNRIRSYIPGLTRRTRRVGPSSTEVSVQVRLAQRIEELQKILATIELQITDYTAKYENAINVSKRARQSSNIRVGLQHLKFSKMYKNHLITLEREKLKIVKLITEAEIDKIQNALKTVTSIEEQQLLLDIIKADIARYRTDYNNIVINKQEAISANKRRANEITQKYVNLYRMYYNMYNNHLKSLEVLKQRTEGLINQNAPGSETAETQQDAITDIDDAMNNARIITNIMSGMPRESPELSIQEFSPEEEALWDEFQAEFQAELNGSTSKGGKKSRKHRTRRRHKKSRKYY